MGDRWAVVISRDDVEEVASGWFDSRPAAEAHLRHRVDPLVVLTTRLMALHFGVCGCSEPATFNGAEMECQGSAGADCGCDCHELEAMVPGIGIDEQRIR